MLRKYIFNRTIQFQIARFATKDPFKAAGEQYRSYESVKQEAKEECERVK